MNIVLLIVTILLPPLGVFLHSGINTDFWINLILTLFGYIPGIIHGIWVLLR